MDLQLYKIRRNLNIFAYTLERVSSFFANIFSLEYAHPLGVVILFCFQTLNFYFLLSLSMLCIIQFPCKGELVFYEVLIHGLILKLINIYNNCAFKVPVLFPIRLKVNSSWLFVRTCVTLKYWFAMVLLINFN